MESAKPDPNKPAPPRLQDQEEATKEATKEGIKKEALNDTLTMILQELVIRLRKRGKLFRDYFKFKKLEELLKRILQRRRPQVEVFAEPTEKTAHILSKNTDKENELVGEHTEKIVSMNTQEPSAQEQKPLLTTAYDMTRSQRSRVNSDAPKQKKGGWRPSSWSRKKR